MEFFRTIAGRLLTGLIILICLGAAVSWWQAGPEARAAFLSVAGRLASWLGVVLFLPWVSFSLVARVSRADSNRAGALLVGGYALMEILLLLALFHFSLPSITAWVFLAVGAFFSISYNVLACDWIAEKLSG